MAIRGDIDDVRYELGRGWVASGWATDPDQPGAPLNIEIFDDARIVAAGPATEFREDLRAAGLGGGRCAFTLPLTAIDPSGHVPVRFSLRVGGSDIVLRSHAVFRLPRFIGCLDGLTGLFAEGWASDTSNLSRPIAVDLLVDGQIVERIETDQFRHDLAEHGLPGGYQGFRWLVPRPFADGRAHRLAAQVANVGQRLGDEIEISVDPRLLTPALNRLYYLREAARQHLLGVSQALVAEGRKRSRHAARAKPPDPAAQ
jgi:hypothetical protein